MIRRRLTDKALSRRMKQLVKQWQNLLQSPTVPNGPAVATATPALNGVAGGPVKGSTPSSVLLPESPHPSLTPVGPTPSPLVQVPTPTPSSAVGLSPVAAPLPTPKALDPPVPAPTPPPSRQTNPTAIRMKMLQRLSKVKTHPLPQLPTTTSTDAQLHTPAQPSLPTNVANNHSHADRDSSSKHLLSSAAAVAESTDFSSSSSAPPTSSLALSFPINSHLSSPEDCDPQELLVHIPRHSLTRVPHDVTRTRSEDLKPSSQTGRKNPTSLVVSISSALLQRCPVQLGSIPHTSDLPLSGIVVGTQPDSSPWDALAEAHPQRSRIMPNGAVSGVDGCHGPDGLWYRWTETIPGEDLSVTVLPYVYIDGLHPMDCL